MKKHRKNPKSKKVEAQKINPNPQNNLLPLLAMMNFKTVGIVTFVFLFIFWKPIVLGFMFGCFGFVGGKVMKRLDERRSAC